MGELHNTYIGSACNYIVHALNTLGELMDRRHTILNRMLIITASIFALAALMGAASATDYYVATTGDNGASGDLMHPWQNVSYATQQADKGDTIYLFDGTWYDEVCTFANSGNATHRITLTAYNGTPTMIGDAGATSMIGIAFDSYITISHLTVRDYTHTITANTGANYSIVSDCDLGHTGGTNYGYVVKIAGQNCHYNTIENCTVHDSGWNSIQLVGNHEPPSGNGIPSTYITIRNCTIYNSTVHNAIDLYGNFQYVTIEGNELYDNPAGCIFEHDYPDHREYVTIRDNNFHDTQSSAINIGANSYYEIYNNTFTNMPSYNPIYIYLGSHDYEIYNNSFYNCGQPQIYGGYNFTFDKNYIHSDAGSYRAAGGVDIIVKNPLGYKDVYLGDPSSSVELLFEDGTVFTASYYWLGSSVPVRYYPEKSNTSGVAKTNDWGTINTVTSYDITLRPTHGHLYDVAVNTWDEATGTYRITASSTESKNPTWINLTTKAASATYDITIDGKSCTPTTTGADGVLRYYTSTWDGPQTFEFSYASDIAPAPLVTKLRNDTPTQQTVTLRWDCSAPDIDHYTIYQNGALLNTTGNQYYSVTDLVSDTTYTFSVSATTTAGITGDSVSITVRTAAEDNPPTARAGSDRTVNVNISVTLDGSTSTDDYGIPSYVWDFDASNGIQQDATGITVSHTYTEPGAYIATLTVTDTSGQTDSDNMLITVIEETTQKTDVSRITESIVPDGSLSEWAGADTVSFAGSDNTAAVSLTWDEDNLYFGFDITDTNLQASGTDGADPLHLDDSIEIYLDTEHNGGAAMQVDDYHFIINLNGALVDDQGTGSGKNYSWTSHINYAIDLDGTLNDDSDTDNGYVVEVAIPWSDIGGAPVTGEVMGLDLAVNDNDGAEVQSFDWCNIDSWAVPDGWGDVTFVENLDNNTLHIPTDITSSRGNSVTVPIMIHNATEVACAGVKLTYDASVVTVTNVAQGDFTAYFGFDDEHAADGWVTINTYINGTQLTGDVKVMDVTLVAVGEVGATSTLDMEIMSMADQNGYAVPKTVSNGLFTVVSDTSPPVVTDPSASQLIPDDTDGIPSWGETATLSVIVTDESDIASVTIDLSAIGGSPVQPMTHIGDNVWSVTTNASAGTPPQTYELQVCATDIYGYTNMSESVELVVMRNGDVTGDGDVNSDDVKLLRTYVTHPGQYTINEFVADVTGDDDGVVNIADAMLLANYVTHPDKYTLR